jgi:diacylglycerol kinase (ATP)
VPADRQRRRRRGRVQADHRRGHEEGRGRDDRARVARDHGREAVADPPSTVFLVNPASANGTTGRRWPEIANRAAARGLHGDALFSERQGHLTELARGAAQAGVERLVVVGGDGSVNEVANGVAGLDGVEIAVIARGTGWDFVRTYGIPRDVEEAAAVALDGETRSIDLGRVVYRTWDGREATSWFANIASAGMSGAVAQRANDTTKALGGKVSYLWATLSVFARWSNNEVRVSVDDEIRGGRMHDVIVANGKFFGGGMKIAPDAESDDGLFDVLLIGDVTKRDLLVTMPRIYRGTHLPHPKAELLRGAAVSVDAPEALPIELDGEQPGTTPARFEIVRNALRVRVPAAG